MLRGFLYGVFCFGGVVYMRVGLHVIQVSALVGEAYAQNVVRVHDVIALPVPWRGVYIVWLTCAHED